MDSQGMGLLPSFLAAIQKNGEYDLSKIDKPKINQELRKFKNQNGTINFKSLFAIPVADRITAMAQKDFPKTVLIISVAIASALEGMNLIRPMTSSQILDLSEAIIDEADSDKLSLEDLVLFLQQLSRGKYDDLYEGIDVPKFLKRFGVYRDERWAEGIRLRDEKHEYYKNLGDDNHHERSNRTSPIDEQMLNYRNKLQAQKDELALAKRENKILRQQRDF